MSTTAVVTVEPGTFDAAAAVAALEKAHYPATKAEDISPTANPAVQDSATEETEGPTEVETTVEPAETEPAEATTEATPKVETEVIE